MVLDKAKPTKDTPTKDTPEKDTPEKDTPEKDTPEKDTPEKDTPEKDTPEKDTPEKDTPEKDTPEKKQILAEIKKHPWIHQQAIVDNNPKLNKSNVSINLAELIKEKRIRMRKKGKKKIYALESVYKNYHELSNNTTKSINDLRNYVHSKIKNSTKHPNLETLRYLDRTIPKIHDQLKDGLEGQNPIVPQEDDMQDVIDDYLENSSNTEKILDEINLKGTIPTRICECNNRAHKLLIQISSLLDEQKKKKKRLHGSDSRRNDIKSNVERLRKYITSLDSHQFQIGQDLLPIHKIKKEIPKFPFIDEEVDVLIRMIEEDKNTLNGFQKNRMAQYQNRINELKQKTKPDKFGDISTGMDEVKKHVDDMMKNLITFNTSLYKLEIAVITDEYVKKLYKKLTKFEKDLQEIYSDLNSNLEFVAKK